VTVQLTNPISDNPAPQTDVPIQVVVNGVTQTVIIPAGSTSSSITFDNVLDSSPYTGAEQEVTISLGVSDPNAGNFEALAAQGDGADFSFNVPQPPATVPLTISVADGLEGDGGMVPATLTLGEPPTEAGTITLTVTDPGGNVIGAVTVDLVPGQSEYVVEVPHGNDEDIYLDESDITVTASVEGGGYALPVVDASDTAHIEDTIDTTTAEIALGTDESGQLVVTISLTNEDGLDTAPGEGQTTTVTFTVNGQTYSADISGKDTSVSISLPGVLDYAGNSGDIAVDARVTGFTSTAGEFEAQAFGSESGVFPYVTVPVAVTIFADTDTVQEAFLHGDTNPTGFSGTAWVPGGPANGMAPSDLPLTATGSFQVNGHMESGTVSMGGSSDISLPADGETVTVSLTDGSCVGDVLTVTNNGGGNYSYEYTMNAAKDHSGVPENADGTRQLEISLQVNVQGLGGETASAGTGINVVDDGICAINPDTIILTGAPTTDYYVTIAFDVTGSMSGTPMALAKAALVSLMQEYENVAGDVKINLVLFSTTATVHADITPAEAITYINNAVASGNTSYAAPLNAIFPLVTEGLDNFSDYTNQVFFISDGAPNTHPQPGGGYVPQDWKDLVNGDQHDNFDVYAVGVGSGALGASAVNNLQAICNQGELGQDGGDTYIHVNNFSQLTEVLHDAANITYGNLAAQNVLGADGVTEFYSYIDGQGNEHVVDWGQVGGGYYKIVLADDGKGNTTVMEVKENGDYILTVRGDATNAVYDSIRIVLVDGDGDRMELSGQIEIQTPGAVNETLSVAPMSAALLDDAQDDFSQAVPHISGQTEGAIPLLADPADAASGSQTIFATSADETMQGGSGEVFAWTQDALGGVDHVVDFNLGGDKLFFEDMFDHSGGQEVGEQIDQMLNDGQLLLSITHESQLELIYNDGSNEQTVHISLSDPLDSAMVADLHNDDDAAKSQLLQQILQAGIS